nr:MAG TPA: sulfotransferase [Caudoviricetes sp.]
MLIICYLRSGTTRLKRSITIQQRKYQKAIQSERTLVGQPN